MVGQRRITKPTLGVIVETGCATVIPAGQIIEILIAPPETNRTVDVLWDGGKMMMFVNDLTDRSQEIKP
jgi:hypothetical protein